MLLGGAALTRSYVERDLREVYEGRLFYGTDAFEGLHTMDRLGAIRAGEEPDDPDWGTVPSDVDGAGPGRPRRARSTTPTSSCPTARPRSPPTTRSRRRRSGAARWSRASRSTTSPATSTRRRCSATSGSSGPRRSGRRHRKETDAEFKERIRPQLRAAAGRGQGRTACCSRPLVYGYFPANADGDDLVIWTDETATEERCRFSYPRQRKDPFLCIADFFRPVDPSGEVDVAAFHIVTMGHAVSERTAELFAADKYQDYLMLHGIGVEMAEALAELWHKRIREELGIADEDGTDLAGLFRQQYHGGRYSWGYPACPDLEDNETVAELLGADRIGIEVSEDTGFQFQPEQSTSALICHHPRAKYFVAR